MGIRTLIVEDEDRSRSYLVDLIREYTPELEIVGEAATVNSALELIKEKNPDLLLLDVELHGKSVFDIFDQLDEKNFNVIFITAYEQYALRAIKYAALDYILKPVNPDEFIEAISKINLSQSEERKSKLKYLLENSLHKKETPDRIVISSMDEMFFIKTSDIICIEASGNYSIFHVADKKEVVATKSIAEYEKMLFGSDFFRIHKSFIVNISHIKKYIKGRGGYVIMNNGENIAVASRKKDEFLNKLNS